MRLTTDRSIIFKNRNSIINMYQANLARAISLYQDTINRSPYVGKVVLTPPNYKSLVDSYIGGDPYVYIVALLHDNNAPIGSTLSYISKNNMKYIAEIYIVRPLRRQGLGKALLHRTISLLKQDNNPYPITLSVPINNGPAIRLYSRYNFIKRSDIGYNPRIQHWQEFANEPIPPGYVRVAQRMQLQEAAT